MLRAASSTDDRIETHSTVFLAYDDLEMHGTLTRRLQSLGSGVKVIDLGTDGIEIDVARHHGCMVLGQKLGQVTGLSLQDKLVDRGIFMPFIFLVVQPDVAEAVEAMRRGAVDVLIAPFDLEKLVTEVRGALKDESLLFAQRVHEDLVRKRIDRLSPREKEVLGLVIGGRLTKQIAGSLLISTKTVETHRGHIMKKMEVNCLPHLIRLVRNFECELTNLPSTPLSDEQFGTRPRQTA